LTVFYAGNSFRAIQGPAPREAGGPNTRKVQMNESSAATRSATARERIEEILDSVRPAIRADGGDIELVGFDELDGVVRIRMVGACHACPMSMLTLKAGIEQRLRMQVPEVRSVESVSV
jgi:Fe-S cluster biogenesis protein NfuA